MSSKASRKRRNQRERPSLFFFIALGVGLLALLLVVARVITSPMQPPPH